VGCEGLVARRLCWEHPHGSLQAQKPLVGWMRPCRLRLGIILRQVFSDADSYLHSCTPISVILLLCFCSDVEQAPTDSEVSGTAGSQSQPPPVRTALAEEPPAGKAAVTSGPLQLFSLQLKKKINCP